VRERFVSTIDIRDQGFSEWFTLKWLNPKSLVPGIKEQREMARPSVPAIRVRDYFATISWFFLIIYISLFFYGLILTIFG
jgi:hypothetical protein